jgi:hypothetical protein
MSLGEKHYHADAVTARSLLPTNVKVLAMTATAARSLRVKASNVDWTSQPTGDSSITLQNKYHPCNIKFVSICEIFTPILEKQRKERAALPRIM